MNVIPMVAVKLVFMGTMYLVLHVVYVAQVAKYAHHLPLVLNVKMDIIYQVLHVDNVTLFAKPV